MALGWARLRTLVREVPREGKLTYCLIRDRRVPVGAKAGLGGALAVIASPLRFPRWIPVLGDFDRLALAVLAVKVFVEACPSEVAREHRSALRRRDSRFDRDLARLVAAVRAGSGRLLGRPDGQIDGAQAPLVREERSA